MDQQTYIIKFDGVSVADANRYANELRNMILDAASGVIIQQRSDDPHMQDFGTVLVLILGGSSVTAIAKAIGDWLKLGRGASLTIEDSQKKVIAKNITGKDALKLAELFLKKK